MALSTLHASAMWTISSPTIEPMRLRAAALVPSRIVKAA